MKIVVGVDIGRHYKATLNLAARLRFPDPEWILAHSVDMTAPITGYGIGELAYGPDCAQMLTEAGERTLDEAKEDADARGLTAQTVILAGTAGGALVQYAEDTHADLVAVHSERKGRLGSLFLGSVSRGLALSAKHSVLISKGQISAEGPLNVVFATDHSEYAKKALDKFIAMGAKGITHIRVMTALLLSGEGGFEHLNLRAGDPAIVESLTAEARRQTDEAVRKLEAAGYQCSGEVIDAPVNEAIGHAMKVTRADLLVMGAQGHGFMHRLMLGSTSLHQVVAEPYPVLIVRP